MFSINFCFRLHPKTVLCIRSRALETISQAAHNTIAHLPYRNDIFSNSAAFYTRRHTYVGFLTCCDLYSVFFKQPFRRQSNKQIREEKKNTKKQTHTSSFVHQLMAWPNRSVSPFLHTEAAAGSWPPWKNSGVCPNNNAIGLFCLTRLLLMASPHNRAGRAGTTASSKPV